MAHGQTWTNIATDPAGDAGAGLDATALDYWYDALNDQVQFRITTTNLASFSTGPAADFSFQLPNGTDGNDPTGTHWTTPGTPVHKTGAIYCDPGGSAPSNYTFTNWPNGMVITSTAAVLCTNCISIMADVPNNQLIYTFDRTDIITDTEMGGTSATLVVVANAGHDVMWDDNITGNGMMTINTGPSNVPERIAADEVAVWPNPAQAIVSIDLGDLQGDLVGAELVDAKGTLVESLAPVNNAILTIDVSDKEAGIYFVDLSFQDRPAIRRKVIVE